MSASACGGTATSDTRDGASSTPGASASVTKSDAQGTAARAATAGTSAAASVADATGTGGRADRLATAPGRCGDERDALLQAYDDQGIPIDLDCGDFTKTRGTARLTFADIFKPTSQPWALLRDPMLAAKDRGYGLDLLIDHYGEARTLNSSYRDPIRNKQNGGARRSRHLFGDAADLRNVTRSMEEWQRMWTAAEKADADYIEPLSGPCKLNCLHADWRNHDGGYRP